MQLLQYLISTTFSFSVSFGQQAFTLTSQGQASVTNG